MQTKTEAGKAHEIKIPALAFGIYGDGARRLGDVAVTAKGLVWKNGKSKDVTVKWDAFVNWMQSQRDTGAKTMKAPKAAKPAAKAAKIAQKAKSAQTSIRRAGSAKPTIAPKGANKINGRTVTTKKLAPQASAKTKSAARTAH
jgi:hypothetical protein